MQGGAGTVRLPRNGEQFKIQDSQCRGEPGSARLSREP